MDWLGRNRAILADQASEKDLDLQPYVKYEVAHVCVTCLTCFY